MILMLAWPSQRLTRKIAAGSAGGISAGYEKSSRETLTRDLAEKIVTTSVYRSSESELAPVALWVDQRGSRD